MRPESDNHATNPRKKDLFSGHPEEFFIPKEMVK
jgi:hypothetical protein